MADPFTGEIRIFAGTFAPADWAFCNGQLIPIQQNSALYAILGAQYGGDGKTNFGLPNLNGMAPMHQGAGPGLTPRDMAETGGAASVTLVTAEMPNHTHYPQALSAVGNQAAPGAGVWSQNFSAGRNPTPVIQYTEVTTAAPVNTTMHPLALGVTGGSLPHNNMQPFLPLQFIICLYGEWPSRP